MANEKREMPNRKLATGHWPLTTASSALRPPPSAFTLTELLVTITIMSILAAMVLGAMHAAGEMAKEYATKATIVKLNNIIMERYESYMTRRVPIQIPAGTQPLLAARMRLEAIRDLMRLEMPDFYSDITNNAFLSGNTNPATSAKYFQTNQPAIWRLYNQAYNSKIEPISNDPAENAKCLYLVVSLGFPEAMEQFNNNEIGVDPYDQRPYFVDGWGRPILWLRWAAGFSSGEGLTPNPFITPAPSDIQTGNPTADHDPFDTRNIDTWTDVSDPVRGFRLVPLIYSAGPDGETGISIGGKTSNVYQYAGDPYWHYDDEDTGNTMYLGSISGGTAFDNITNHHIEQR